MTGIGRHSRPPQPLPAAVTGGMQFLASIGGASIAAGVLAGGYRLAARHRPGIGGLAPAPQVSDSGVSG